MRDMFLDTQPGDPNAGVYDIVEVVDAHRLRISPSGRANGEAKYSVGRRSYGSFRVANCEFFMLDTRSHRSLHDVKNPEKKGATILGKQQLKRHCRNHQEPVRMFQKTLHHTYSYNPPLCS